MIQTDPIAFFPSIPLDSTEKLWEWHIPSDRLFFSKGTRLAFGLSDGESPATMAAFFEHIPEGCLQSLCELREGVIGGDRGFLETAYPVENFFVRERLFVLERDAEGRAIRIAGQFEIAPGTMAYLPPVSTVSKGQAQICFWNCSLEKRTLWVDANGSRLLGYAEAIPRVFNLDEWKERLHPEEGTDCRYQLIIEQPLFGDELTDDLRVRKEDGSYVKIWVRGSILSRDTDGHAVSMSGTWQPFGFVEERHEQRTPENGSLLSALNAAGDGLWDWNPITDEVYYSPRWLSMLGYTAEQFPGRLETWKEKIHPDDLKKIVEPQRKLADSPKYGDTFECTYRLKRLDGSYAWILGRGYVTHRDAKGRATRIVGLHTNITASQADRDYFEKLAQNDALTGLHSRTYFDIKLANIENKGIRPLCVISCDVNGLKLANDYMGILSETSCSRPWRPCARKACAHRIAWPGWAGTRSLSCCPHAHVRLARRSLPSCGGTLIGTTPVPIRCPRWFLLGWLVPNPPISQPPRSSWKPIGKCSRKNGPTGKRPMSGSNSGSSKTWTSSSRLKTTGIRPTPF